MKKKVTPFQYAVLLYEITSDGKNIQKRIGEFLGILAKNNDISLLSKIIKEFETYDKKQKGIIDVEIISAESIPREIKKQILNSINTEGGLEIKETVNAELLGGFIFIRDDTMIDSSLKEKLRGLNKALIYG